MSNYASVRHSERLEVNTDQKGRTLSNSTYDPNGNEQMIFSTDNILLSDQDQVSFMAGDKTAAQALVLSEYKPKIPDISEEKRADTSVVSFPERLSTRRHFSDYVVTEPAK